MKKTILTLFLAVWTTITFSQYVFSLTIGVRDNSDEVFAWGETKIMDSSIPVKFDGKDITIYTNKTQYYQTLMPEYEVDGGSYWFAYDANMKKCKFYMVEVDGDNFIMIEYDDVCIVYGVNYN
jgi:hypothetical protein